MEQKWKKNPTQTLDKSLSIRVSIVPHKCFHLINEFWDFYHLGIIQKFFKIKYFSNINLVKTPLILLLCKWIYYNSQYNFTRQNYFKAQSSLFYIEYLSSKPSRQHTEDHLGWSIVYSLETTFFVQSLVIFRKTVHHITLYFKISSLN